MIADAETEMPIAFFIAPANMHEKRAFRRLFDEVKSKFVFSFMAKYLADAAYDSTDIREELHYNNIKDVIAINGRRDRKSSLPKDPEYGKRWSIERIFSRLKEVFGLARNRVVGMKKVAIHIYSCLLGYLLTYLM
jgi:transposase